MKEGEREEGERCRCVKEGEIGRREICVCVCVLEEEGGICWFS